jgi:hypothetical protein
MRHYLRENKSTRFPTSWGFLHVASSSHISPDNVKVNFDTFLHGVIQFARFDRDGWNRIKWASSAEPALLQTALIERCSETRPLWVMSYNLPYHLTLLNFWDSCDSGVFNLRSVVDEDPPTIIKARTPKGDVVFVDIQNYLREPLADIADSLHWTQHLKWDVYECEEQARAHCEAMTMLYRAIADRLIDFVRVHDLGNFRTTIPAQAMQAYRHRFGPRKTVARRKFANGKWTEAETYTRVVPVIHDDEPVKRLEMRASFAVPSECFYVGPVVSIQDKDTFADVLAAVPGVERPAGKIYHVDVNSLFPSKMLGYAFPWKLISSGDSMTVSDYMGLPGGVAVIADVAVDTGSCGYPKRCGKKVCQCIGRFWTTLCGAELRHAIDNNHVRAIGQFALYSSDVLFDSYVEYFWNLKADYRASGNVVWSNLAKLFLNGLHGKFGQRSAPWVDLPAQQAIRRWGRWVYADYDTREVTEFRGIAGFTQRRAERGLAVNSFGAIPPFVTSACRVYMHTLRGIAGSGNVYYQGCDSFILNETGWNNLRARNVHSETAIGHLKEVGRYDAVEIRNIRSYTLDGRAVIAGIKRGAVLMPDGAYHFEAGERLGGILSRKPRSVYVRHIANARLHSSYSHGTVKPDGWTVPFVLSEWSNGQDPQTANPVAGQPKPGH